MAGIGEGVSKFDFLGGGFCFGDLKNLLNFHCFCLYDSSMKFERNFSFQLFCLANCDLEFDVPFITFNMCI